MGDYDSDKWRIKMSTVRRVYVEKKPEFAIKAKDLKHEIKHYLNIQTVTNVRELIRYDVENISDETYEKACKVVFAEPPVDICYQEDFPRAEGARVFSVEFLPGFCRTVRAVLKRRRAADHPLRRYVCYRRRDD